MVKAYAQCLFSFLEKSCHDMDGSIGVFVTAVWGWLDSICLVWVEVDSVSLKRKGGW